MRSLAAVAGSSGFSTTASLAKSTPEVSRPIGGITTHGIRRLGIARTFQSGRLFGELPVIDNLEVTGVGLGLSRREACAKAEAMLAWIGISALADRIAGGLPYTDERRVAIGRALMSNPKVLLLDEVSLGLSPVAIEGLYEQLAGLKARGDTAMIVVEQDLDRTMGFSDRVICMLEGRIVLEGEPQTLGKPAITEAYFGLTTGELTHA